MSMDRPAFEIRADLRSIEDAISFLCTAPRDLGMKPDRTWSAAVHGLLDRAERLRAELNTAVARRPK